MRRGFPPQYTTMVLFFGGLLVLTCFARTGADGCKSEQSECDVSGMLQTQFLQPAHVADELPGTVPPAVSVELRSARPKYGWLSWWRRKAVKRHQAGACVCQAHSHAEKGALLSPSNFFALTPRLVSFQVVGLGISLRRFLQHPSPNPQCQKLSGCRL